MIHINRTSFWCMMIMAQFILTITKKQIHLKKRTITPADNSSAAEMEQCDSHCYTENYTKDYGNYIIRD